MGALDTYLSFPLERFLMHDGVLDMFVLCAYHS